MAQPLLDGGLIQHEMLNRVSCNSLADVRARFRSAQLAETSVENSGRVAAADPQTAHSKGSSSVVMFSGSLEDLAKACAEAEAGCVFDLQGSVVGVSSQDRVRAHFARSGRYLSGSPAHVSQTNSLVYNE